MPEVLDVVQLAVPAGKWPAGTIGTLLESYEDGGIVEIANEDSEGIDLIAVPYGAIRVPESADARSPDRLSGAPLG